LDNDKKNLVVRSKTTFDQTTKFFWAIPEFFHANQENVVTTINNQNFWSPKVDDQNFRTMPKLFLPSLDQWSFLIIQQKEIDANSKLFRAY